MVRITVDPDRCRGEGICRAVCPKGARIYKIVDLGGGVWLWLWMRVVV
ncbi:MAG: hypothetical protein QXR19_11860 [Candidatus Jordarchaeaceae archaeon]